MRGVPIGTWIRETIRQAPELVQTDESPESRSPGVWRHEHSKPRRPRLDRLKYLAINVFVAFHILGIACWCLPIDAPLIQVCRKLISPYFVWSGLFQSWDMFAPTPKGVNTYIEAVIVYRDGTRTSWTFPRMEFLGLRQKFFKERYRKFTDNLVRVDTDALLPDAARYIARMKSDPEHQVKTVILIQKWSSITPRPDGSYFPGPWEQHVLLGYGVQPGDLK